MLKKRHEEPEIDISHASLERTGDSAYRSVSPCCGSFLLVRRAPGDKLHLSRHDACVLCGQRYRYMDETINGEQFSEDTDLESKELTPIDLELLRKWGMSPEDPRAWERILIGRLQRKIGVYDDGLYGPHTERALPRLDVPLGPEISRILNERGWVPT